MREGSRRANPLAALKQLVLLISANTINHTVWASINSSRHYSDCCLTSRAGLRNQLLFFFFSPHGVWATQGCLTGNKRVDPLPVLTDRRFSAPADRSGWTRTKSRPRFNPPAWYQRSQICSDGVTASCSHAWTILSETYRMWAQDYCYCLSNICSCCVGKTKHLEKMKLKLF